MGRGDHLNGRVRDHGQEAHEGARGRPHLLQRPRGEGGAAEAGAQAHPRPRDRGPAPAPAEEEPKPEPKPRSGRYLKLTCGCGHMIPTSKTVAEKAIVRCDDCGEAFTEAAA